MVISPAMVQGSVYKITDCVMASETAQPVTMKSTAVSKTTNVSDSTETVIENKMNIQGTRKSVSHFTSILGDCILLFCTLLSPQIRIVMRVTSPSMQMRRLPFKAHVILASILQTWSAPGCSPYQRTTRSSFRLTPWISAVEMSYLLVRDLIS